MSQRRVSKLLTQLKAPEKSSQVASEGDASEQAPRLNPERKPVCVVAGAGPGLGSAILEEFIGRGFIAVGCRRKSGSMREITDALNTKAGSRVCFGFAKDMRVESEVQEWIDEIIRDFGSIDMAVYNIGANVRFPIADTTSRVFRKVWEMAAFGAFLFGKAVAIQMVAQQRGCLVFTGATASVISRSPFAAFASAKHACRALARAMAHELGPSNIHVSHIIVDGPIESDFMRSMLQNFNKDAKEYQSWMKRLMKPSDIAENYWHLYCQKPTAWTFELDLRSQFEKW